VRVSTHFSQCFLTLQAPFIPPVYLNFARKPHVGGITLSQPLLSNHCIDLSDSLPKPEQHATVMKLPKADRNALNPVGQSTPRISLFKPLQTEYQCIYADRPKPLDVIRQKPGWMPILPSNRNPYVRLPRNSALQWRLLILQIN
jgi:hypothetical protein